MTKILMVAATAGEAAFLTSKKNLFKTGQINKIKASNTNEVDVLITGPGITFTTYHLAKALAQNTYDLAINIGICGSLVKEIVPVRVVNVVQDQFGDFGAENGTEFLDVFETGLMSKNEFPFKNGMLKASFTTKLQSLNPLPKVTGITVQKVHGSTGSAKAAFQKFGPVIETMEGAAFFYVCHMQKLKCLQIRSVSNKVEKRNRENWKITEATAALAGVTGLVLLELENAF